MIRNLDSRTAVGRSSCADWGRLKSSHLQLMLSWGGLHQPAFAVHEHRNNLDFFEALKFHLDLSVLLEELDFLSLPFLLDLAQAAGLSSWVTYHNRLQSFENSNENRSSLW